MVDCKIKAALEQPLTTPEVVADILQVPVRTVQRMLDRKQIAGIRFGRVQRAYTAPFREILGISASE